MLCKKECFKLCSLHFICKQTSLLEGVDVMTSGISAFMLCQRRADKRYLCIRNRTFPDQYSFFSISVDGSDRASYDELRAKAMSLLDLQLFDRELCTFSESINGSHGPRIVFCKVAYLLDRRIVRRIQETSHLDILFLSLEEIQQFALEDKIARETVEIVHYITQ